MRPNIWALGIACLLLTGALFAGCTSTNSGYGTTPPTTSAPVQTTASAATATPTASAMATAGTGQITLTAKNFAFDTSTITAPAGSTVTVTFINNDTGAPHNVAFYTDSTARTPIYVGQIVTGPATTTYTFTAPSQPGTYFFRCDVHPETMTGSFVVT
jgi:plastocyanin